MRNKYFIFLFCTLYAQLGFCAAEKEINQLNLLKNQLSEHQQKLTDISASINSLEQEIGGKNNIYIQNYKKLNELELTSRDIANSLGQINESYQVQKNQYNKIVRGYIVSQFNPGDASSLLAKKVYKSRLAEVNDEMSKTKEALTRIQSDYDIVQKNLAELKLGEDGLKEKIDGLEYKKNLLAQDYLKILEDKSGLEKEIEKLSLELKGKKLIAKTSTGSEDAGQMIPPISEFINYQKEQKGINFYYADTTALKATQNGEVAYVGHLGAYGDVIMIDHGDNIRSVILGKIKSRVTKGQNVKKGQMIGYAVNNSKEKTNLYFEVRKKNKVQNTYALIDKNFLAEQL